MQTGHLDANQGKELCDEIASMLLNTLESQSIDDKVEAAVNVFLAKQKFTVDPSDLAQRLSWSIKVKLDNK